MHGFAKTRFWRCLFTLPGLLLFAVVAVAAIVTAAEVAEAIRNSPNASPWLRANADDVGNLAMFESSGDTAVYNGSCCYGILQLTATNIDAYAHTTPEEFRNWPLQQQVDAWAALTSPALNYAAPQALIAMGTFDGRPVDGNLVLSCIQLGVGNCQTMINSGSCGGFRDSNGTSICDMADAIAGGSPGTTLPGPETPGSEPGYTPPSGDIASGFLEGSGVEMHRLRAIIQALLAATTMLIIGSALLGVWRRYAGGGIGHADLIHYMIRGLVTVGLVFVIMSMF